MKNRTLLNIASVEDMNGNRIIQSDNNYFTDQYYREASNFFDGQEFDRFIKSCESCIRKSSAYSAYIDYLKTVIGLNHCMIHGHITDDVADIEMHHGPIFTLYDYVKIVIDYFLYNNIPISTFTVAKVVIDEHILNNVQVIMLTKNNHGLVHEGTLNLTLDMAWGNIYAFINKYKDFIFASPFLVNKIKAYSVKVSNENHMNNDVIHINKPLTWNNSQQNFAQIQEKDFYDPGKMYYDDYSYSIIDDILFDDDCNIIDTEDDVYDEDFCDITPEEWDNINKEETDDRENSVYECYDINDNSINGGFDYSIFNI